MPPGHRFASGENEYEYERRLSVLPSWTGEFGQHGKTGTARPARQDRHGKGGAA
ncbi:hypothetical protein [Streptomyces prasinus]|uniref:hypothetical protein n=1 Tax=Streptomyces prasinus TaxID=67345 RepID=UPI0036C38297